MLYLENKLTSDNDNDRWRTIYFKAKNAFSWFSLLSMTQADHILCRGDDDDDDDDDDVAAWKIHFIEIVNRFFPCQTHFGLPNHLPKYFLCLWNFVSKYKAFTQFGVSHFSVFSGKDKNKLNPCSYFVWLFKCGNIAHRWGFAFVFPYKNVKIVNKI